MRRSSRPLYPATTSAMYGTAKNTPAVERSNHWRIRTSSRASQRSRSMGRSSAGRRGAQRSSQGGRGVRSFPTSFRGFVPLAIMPHLCPLFRYLSTGVFPIQIPLRPPRAVPRDVRAWSGTCSSIIPRIFGFGERAAGSSWKLIQEPNPVFTPECDRQPKKPPADWRICGRLWPSLVRRTSFVRRTSSVRFTTPA